MGYEFQGEQNAQNRDYEGSLRREELEAGEKSDIIGAGALLGGAYLGRGGRFFGTGGGEGIAGTSRIGGMLGKIPGAGYIKPAILSAGAGYLGSRIAKAGGLIGKEKSKATTRASKAGTVIGTGAGALLGGPLGAGIGGAVGGKIATEVTRFAKKLCFDPSTPVGMMDGSFTLIKNIKIGDITMGGEVYSIRISDGTESPLYNYNGVKVTGSHAVKEYGTWVRVQDSLKGNLIGTIPLTYSICTSQHRIYVNDIEFADEQEFDNYESMNEIESLNKLNEEEDLCQSVHVV